MSIDPDLEKNKFLRMVLTGFDGDLLHTVNRHRSWVSTPHALCVNSRQQESVKRNSAAEPSAVLFCYEDFGCVIRGFLVCHGGS